MRRFQEDPGSGDQELRGVERLTLPAIGRRGLGVSRVRGRILVPNPYDTSYIINLRDRRQSRTSTTADSPLVPPPARMIAFVADMLVVSSSLCDLDAEEKRRRGEV